MEEAEGEGELAGAEGVAQDDVEGEDGRRVGGDVEHPVEQGKGAAPVGLAGEKGDHEARGEPVAAVRGAEIRRHHCVELFGGAGLAQGQEHRLHIHAPVHIMVVPWSSPPYVSAATTNTTTTTCGGENRAMGGSGDDGVPGEGWFNSVRRKVRTRGREGGWLGKGNSRYLVQHPGNMVFGLCCYACHGSAAAFPLLPF